MGPDLQQCITASAGSVFRIGSSRKLLRSARPRTRRSPRARSPHCQYRHYDGIIAWDLICPRADRLIRDRYPVHGNVKPGDDYTKVTGSSSGTLTGSSINSIFGGLQSGFYEGRMSRSSFTGNYR